MKISEIPYRYRYYKFLYSKEFRDIEKIIAAGAADESRTSIQKECDSVFTDRLRDSVYHLSMRPWETHFEWRDLIRKYPMINGEILDLGCGSGHMDVMLARNGRTVHGIDLSPIGISIAQYLRSKEPTDVQKRLDFELRDITSENVNGRLFDSAWSAHVFEHIAMPGPVLEGLKNYLKSSAPVLISVPYQHAYDDPGHVNHFYSAQELYDWLSPHISVEKVELCEENQVLRALCTND